MWTCEQHISHGLEVTEEEHRKGGTCSLKYRRNSIPKCRRVEEKDEEIKISGREEWRRKRNLEDREI